MLGCRCPFRVSLSGHFGLLAFVTAATFAGVLLRCHPADAMQEPASPPQVPTAPQVASGPGSPGGTTQEPDAAALAPVDGQKSVWAQLGLPEPNPNAPYANPPRLELLFEDDFATDTRGDYEIGGKEGAVTWEPGKLTLGDGAKLSRPLNGDNWVELELNIQFPELTEDGQKSELKILLDLEPATDGYLLLRQRRRDGRTSSEILLYDTPPSNPNGLTLRLPRKVRAESTEGPFPSGLWKVGYHGGVWSISRPNDPEPWSAFIENGHATVTASGISCSGESAFLIRFAANRVPPVSAVFSDEQTRELRESAELSRRVVLLWQNRKSAEALSLAQQTLEIRQRKLGQFHGDTSLGLFHLALLYDSMGDYARAEPLYLQALEIREKVFGKEHPDYAVSLNKLAMLYDSMDDYARAEPLFRQDLEILEKVLGKEHPEYATSLNNLAGLYRSMGDYARAEPLYLEALEIREKVLGKEHPSYATSLNNLGELYKSMGDYARAEPLYREALEILEKALGKEHPDYATSLNNLGELYDSMGDYPRLEPLYLQALEIREKVWGKEHPHYATSLNNLAGLYDSMGDYARAEPLYLQALEIREKVWGKEHPDYATSLNNLALLYHSMGDYARAEPLCRQALAIREKVLGKEHPLYATSLNNLALLHYSMGDYARAEPLYREALEISEKAFGKEHRDYATSLFNLGELYKSMGDNARAEPLYREALEIFEKVLGKEHPLYAASLNNLALLYNSMGDYARAEPLFRQAFVILEKVLGKEHPDYARSLNNLALLHYSMGDFARAEPLFRQALEILEKVLGKEHPDYANSLNNLAGLYRSMGDNARAEPLYREVVQISVRHLEATAAVQSESQQLQMAQRIEYQLINYLASVAESKGAADDVMADMLRWKGAIFARQRLMRLAGETDDPLIKETLEELQAVASQLATLSLAVPSDPAKREAWQQRLADLNSQRDQLERELSGASAAYRAIRQRSKIEVASVLAVLPADAALVDVYRYVRKLETKDQDGVPNYEPGYCAFVLRPGRELKLVELGSKSRIDELIGQWRQGYGRTTTHQAAPGSELHELLWKPLVPELDGVKTVLLSPEGPLAMLPWGALPGRQPGSFLVEEFAFVTVPIPGQLPEMMQASPISDAAAADSILLVGDVDYGASAGQSELAAFSRSAPLGPGSGLRAWGPLDDTRREISAIRDSFESNFPNGRVTMLRRGEATEGALRTSAPAHRLLHIATHGYFAPESMKSALASIAGEQQRLHGGLERSVPTGYHPGVLSGLVMAGANNEPLPDRDDGIMTALEVGDLDLGQVDCVVMSACSTGLGQVAGGEGILGLQRSFQIAGARTTVTSLWDVDSAATKELMIRFYENLYHVDPDKRAPSRIEALRRAQLDLLSNPQFSRSGKDELADSTPSTRLPPEFWAAWVLSGDWR